MSAAKKLKKLAAMQKAYPHVFVAQSLAPALPEIVAVVEAAGQTLHYVDGSAVLKHKPGTCSLCDALAALDEALS